MADEKLLIEIDAKVDGATKAIEGFGKSLKAESQAAAGGIAALNKQVANATPTLINFGRVIQDAPFGLIGIANNIDPLISSFQSLKATTGSAGTAFKALAGSLLGPAGIGIAISAVTSLLIALGPKLFGASKEAKELDKALKGAADSAAQDLVKLQLYVGFATDVTKSYGERKKAVDALQQAYPQYLKNVSDEAILTGRATEAINASVDAILRKATLNLLRDEIAAVVAESAKQILAIEKGIIAAKQAQLAQERLKKGLDGTNDEFEKQAQAALASGRAMGDITREFSALNNQAQQFVENTPEKRIARIKDELQALVAPLLSVAKNFEDIGDFAPKAAKGVKAVDDAVKKFGLGFSKDTGIEGFFNQFNQRERDLIQISARITTTQAKKDLEAFITQVRQQEAIQNGFVIPVKFKLESIKVPLAAANQEIADAQAAAAKNHAAFMDNLSNITTNAVTSAISAMAQGVGDLISGAATPFQAFFQVISAAMKQFGESLVAFGIAKIALEKLFKGPQGGPLAIAAGFGLIALSQVVKNFTGPKLAEGGIVNGPTLAMVGDNPGKKEAIIPIEKWDMLNSGGGVVVLETVVRGQDLVLIQDRARQSFRRTNG